MASAEMTGPLSDAPVFIPSAATDSNRSPICRHPSTQMPPHLSKHNRPQQPHPVPSSLQAGPVEASQPRTRHLSRAGASKPLLATSGEALNFLCCLLSYEAGQHLV